MPFSSSWRSPSNIALIKYWGKHGIQLPRNPSISLTLSACHTDMSVVVTPQATSPVVNVLYDGAPRPEFEPKIKSFLTRVESFLPWLKEASVVMDSVNTFPHSAGIASSASALSALALCLCEVDDRIHNRPFLNDQKRKQFVSEIARLGSGSACRSVFPVAALWGKTENVPDSSDHYAIPWANKVSSLFHSYQDSILIVSSTEKKTSSTKGHSLMEDHPYAALRYKRAQQNVPGLIDAMRDEDMGTFITICESEALQLHALMMMGKNPFTLLKPSTISIIDEIRDFRVETGIPVCFTLDAGPNVHLLYPSSYKSQVHDLIKTSLIPHCTDGLYILDEVGQGPVQLTDPTMKAD